MDFSLLKSFIAVADEKSFSLAAKHLFISQQSLSKQIAKLEEELGTQLFLRSRPLGSPPTVSSFCRLQRVYFSSVRSMRTVQATARTGIRCFI